MSTKDADRVKEHTGVDPEELEDDELATAMSELGIEQQKVTDADVEEGSAAPAAAAAPAAPAAPAAAGGSDDYMEELQKLASLRDAGILTDEEFNAKKAQILGLN
jgi:ribosomal protein L12E/L44/L45/RPP1/RPP2